MRKVTFATCSIAVSLFAFFCFISCEKTEYIGGDTTEEVDDEDYGGWIEDGDDDDYGDFPTGSTVDVTTFRNSAIYTQVWVKGYIVGAATGKNNKMRYEFGPDFTYDTAILLADEPEEDDLDKVISVRLVQGSRRELLNLKDNPGNKGQLVKVFGFQDIYLKIPGIKDIDGLEFPVK